MPRRGIEGVSGRRDREGASQWLQQNAGVDRSAARAWANQMMTGNADNQMFANRMLRGSIQGYKAPAANVTSIDFSDPASHQAMGDVKPLSKLYDPAYEAAARAAAALPR